MREETNRTGSTDGVNDQPLADTSAASASRGDTGTVVSNSEGDGKKVIGDDGGSGREKSTEPTKITFISPDNTTSKTCLAVATAEQVITGEETDAEATKHANSREIIELDSGDSVTEVKAPSKSDEVAVAGGEGSKTMVLKDGRVMAPAFLAGEVFCHDISTTSVRVTWPKFSDRKYPVYAYRVCTAEVGSGFEVTYGEAPSHTTEAVIVGLKPGKAYQFLVATISAERMLVPGSSIVSNPVRMPRAEYEKAWFFEGGEDDIKWTAFEGLGPDSVGPTVAGDVGAGGGSTALDDIRCSLTPTRCYTGLQSLCLTVPPGLVGGAYVDTPVKEGWLYVVKAKVFHEGEDPTEDPSIAGAGAGRKGSKLERMTNWAAGRKGSKPESVTTRLVLWDMRDGKEMSAPAVKTGEWEELECQIVPFRSEHLRITIQHGGEGGAIIYVDAVELVHGGPTPAERAVSSVVSVMDEPRPMPSKVLIHLESARNVRAADTMGTSDPYVKVFVGDMEVHRTKVIPMTLSPTWDETFFISPETRDRDEATNDCSVRFEIWDHDLHGGGDYLGAILPPVVQASGEVCLTNDELKASPPHRAEHHVGRHPARSSHGTKDSDNTPTATENPRLRKARKKRGTGGSRPNGMGAGGPPTILALAVQVSWPEDPESAEGKLVRDLQNDQGLLSTRVEALKELSLAALREPRNIEDAAKAKEMLLRARAAEAAVWVLSDPDFLEDACRLLAGLVKLGAIAGGTEAGFSLCRRLRLFVLQLSPAVVVVRCLRGNIGPPEALLDLLAKLYVGHQAALHEDAVEIRGFFYSLVVHIDTYAPAQALVREISGGGREFTPRLMALFRRYRTRIPPLPGLWRTSVLQKLSAEEAHPPDTEWDDLEANEEDGDDPQLLHGKTASSNQGQRGGRGGEPSVWELVRGNLAVALMVMPPLFKAVVGAKRVGGSMEGGSCEQPVGTMLLLDGLLLICAALGGGCFRINRQRFSALAGTCLFPLLVMAFLLHLGLVAGLLVSIAKVNSVEAGGGRDQDDGTTQEQHCDDGADGGHQQAVVKVDIDDALGGEDPSEVESEHTEAGQEGLIDIGICHATMMIFTDWSGMYPATGPINPRPFTLSSPVVTYDTTVTATIKATMARTTATAALADDEEGGEGESRVGALRQGRGRETDSESESDLGVMEARGPGQATPFVRVETPTVPGNGIQGDEGIDPPSPPSERGDFGGGKDSPTNSSSNSSDYSSSDPSKANSSSHNSSSAVPDENDGNGGDSSSEVSSSDSDVHGAGGAGDGGPGDPGEDSGGGRDFDEREDGLAEFKFDPDDNRYPSGREGKQLLHTASKAGPVRWGLTSGRTRSRTRELDSTEEVPDSEEPVPEEALLATILESEKPEIVS
eukprot:g5963.t1